MPTLVTVTQPESNEIVLSSSYLEAQGSVARLGASQIEHTSATNALVDDIFFKFYLCNDSIGEKLYLPLDVSAAVSDPTVLNQFLTMLFTQYYGDSTFVADIGGAFIDIAERLSGSVTSTNLSETLTVPDSASTSYVEFVGMGVGSYVGANYINGGTGERPSQVWGTRVGQVHVTAIDPLASPKQESLYDNTDSGCWQFSDYGCDGIIVYTNISGSATFAPGLSVWSQLLCTWPIIAETLSANMACIFNTLDQSFLRSGLGYFDRAGRVGSFYGWSGNFLQSIFNDWGIPVVSPIWGIGDLGLAAYLNYGGLGGSIKNNYGALDHQAKGFRFIGPQAVDNISLNYEKNVRSQLPLLWANECTRGSTSLVSSAVANFNATISALGYASGAQYVSLALADTAEGYNAHVYKYIQDEVLGSLNTPTVTREFISSGVSWASKLASQPPLHDVFADSGSGNPKYFPPAYSSFYDSGLAGTYGAALVNRIVDGSLIEVEAMNTAQRARLLDWLYTP